MTTTAMPNPSPGFLQFEGISKIYPGVRALNDVSFGIQERSVHALLGENGAGKSTLLKTLSGAHTPTSGNLRIAGNSVVFQSTSQAIQAGVGVIYQELHLVPELSVAENIFLGHMPARGGVIQKRKLHDAAALLLKRVGENISPGTLVSRLSIGQRQMIEIAKALSRGAKIIAFDEPTSSLSAREIARLFEVIRDLQKQRCAILYVTHRMEEVYRICDSATVLRDGKHVITFDSLKDVSADRIVKSMVGRDIADIFNYKSRPVDHQRTVLQVTNLEGPGVRKPVSLQLHPGEIVGLFGLVGAGRSELMKLIYGAVRPKGGSVSVDGKPAKIRRPSHAIKRGLLLCPEDRKKEGIFPIASVMDNINVSARRHNSWGGFVIRNAWERQNAQHHVTQLGVKTPSLEQLIRNLSGGNQQKAILGRWLSEKLTVLLLDEPTRGIDIGAKSEIYSIIYRLAEQGVAILVVSSDLPEVLGLTDRVLVMREGALSGELSRQDATPESALSLALPTGVTVSHN